MVRPQQGWYSFRNGVYDVFNDAFHPYGTAPRVCTVQFVDAEFRQCAAGRWQDIPTPALTKILTDQRLEPHVQDWVWILLGRTLWPIKTHDKWEVVLYFQVGPDPTGSPTAARPWRAAPPAPGRCSPGWRDAG